MRHGSCVLVATLLVAGCAAKDADVGPGDEGLRPTVTFGISLASVEEGARILGVVRLMPFEHPDAHGHEFPNPSRFSTDEVETLIHLGRKAGLGLRATLTRYPSQPGPWPYTAFAKPPLTAIRSARVFDARASDSSIPGIRAVAYRDRDPIAFIIDTRGMTLEERGMARPTTMGIDVDRAGFLAGLRQLAARAPARGAAIVVVQR